MRSAILQLPEPKSAGERRQVLHAAVRQLERAELYLAAVGSMELDDRAAGRSLNQLRSDLESLKRYLGKRQNQVNA